MMKIKVLFIVFVLMAGIAKAQVLKVQGTTPSLYLTHTVAAKETWYSIGRLYNVSPKEIAPLNNTTMDKPLAIGQSVKIPLTTNFTQDGTKAADELFVPVYHTVQEKEWLYRISQSNNKVPVANLEKWNNITNDGVKPGMNLIVGYLKVKQGQSALAAKGSTKITAVTAAPAPAVAKIEAVKEEVKKETPVVVSTPATTTATTPATTPVKEATTTTEKPEEHKVVTTTPPATTTPAEKPVTTPATTPATTTTTAPATTTPANTPAITNYKGGYFKTMYSNDGKSTTGNAGIFKSTSGWKDGKYYALMNNVPVGTIVKVTFTSTQKTVYAKVLGQLPEMKESIGLTIRLSDAAASELGAENSKFYVDVKY